MREGSYTQIRPGMRVMDVNGETVGGVQEVIVDEGSDIFVGLSVRPNLFTHPLFVPGEFVERLHDEVVYLSVPGDQLQPYHSPAERHHEVERSYEEEAPAIPPML
jgi:uncharacterized protein YrrD